MLTVYGIETQEVDNATLSLFVPVATVLTVYGIETVTSIVFINTYTFVATVLTVYGIETFFFAECDLKFHLLQQCLPFTVLKLHSYSNIINWSMARCNSAYRLRY